MYRTIWAHEINVGDMLESEDDILHIMGCDPDQEHPKNQRRIRYYSQKTGKFHEYDDGSVDIRHGKFPFVYGRFVTHRKGQS